MGTRIASTAARSLRMHGLSRSQSALTPSSQGAPRVGKRRGRLAALKDEMTEKASASPISGAGDSKGSLDPSEQITFTDDPVLPEVSEAAKKELQDRLCRMLLMPLIPPDFHTQIAATSSSGEEKAQSRHVTVLQGRVDA